MRTATERLQHKLDLLSEEVPTGDLRWQGSFGICFADAADLLYDNKDLPYAEKRAERAACYIWGEFRPEGWEK